MIKVKIYVINLKRRSDRYESFCNKYPLDKSKLNKFEAFDGRYIKKIPNYFKSLVSGEVGCFLSHKALWEKLLNDKDVDYYIIFEDDAKFSKNFLENFNNLINEFTHFDSILYLGGRFTESYKMINCIKHTKNIVKYDYNKKWNAYDCERTTHSYIINKNCCNLFIKDFNRRIESYYIKSFSFPPVDHYMTHILRLNKKDIYHTYPLLCHSEIDSDSDIR